MGIRLSLVLALLVSRGTGLVLPPLIDHSLAVSRTLLKVSGLGLAPAGGAAPYCLVEHGVRPLPSRWHCQTRYYVASNPGLPHTRENKNEKLFFFS